MEVHLVGRAPMDAAFRFRQKLQDLHRPIAHGVRQFDPMDQFHQVLETTGGRRAFIAHSHLKVLAA